MGDIYCHFAPPRGEGWDGGYLLSILPPIQTEFKENFESMSLYRHMALFQPQALRAKKQTFSNSDCCHLRGQEEDCCKSSPLYSELANVMERPASLARSRGEGWGVGMLLRLNSFPCEAGRRAVTLRRQEGKAGMGDIYCHFAPPRATCVTSRRRGRRAESKRTSPMTCPC
jgi:hypothetical protein